MEKSLKILLLEDDPTDAEMIQWMLLNSKKNCSFKVVMDRENFLISLKEFSPDVILSDHSMPQFSANEALKFTRQWSNHIPFILVTGTVSDEFASAIIKQGADDYILKDRMTRLPASIDAAISQRRIQKEILDYKFALDQFAIVAITDQRGVIQYANGNFCKISKYSAEELVGQDHRILNSGLHSKIFMKNMWETISKGQIWRGEIRNKAKDGQFYWVDTTIIPFLNENLRPSQYLSIRTDITERKKVEDELTQSNQRFIYATMATADIIWELNFQTHAYDFYQGKQKKFAFTDIFSWKQIVEGRYIHAEERAKIRRSFLYAMGDPAREFWEEECRIYSDNDTILHVINHAMFIRNERGKAIRVVGALTDITEKKQLQKESAERAEKEQLIIIATALEAQEKERNAIGVELHDNVNQLLVSVKLLLSVIKNDLGKYVILLDDSISIIQRAIDENRKIAHGLVTPNFRDNSLMDQIVILCEMMLSRVGIKVTVRACSEVNDKLSEQQKMTVYRIAQEQCTNIIKYAHAKHVLIRQTSDDPGFRMIISDDGQGMLPEKKCTGIGLSNIKGRLRLYDGAAFIKTEPGRGFSLEIFIPYKI